MPFVPAARVVPVLGLGTTFGLTVSGIALLVLVRRECGPRGAAPGAARVPRRARRVRGRRAGGRGGVVGHLRRGARAAGRRIPANVGLSVLVAVVVTAVFAAVVLRLDGGDVRTALSRLRARPRA